MIAAGILTGLLIGLVGVGGVLLAPLLHYVWDVDLHRAMATSSWSFLFTGVPGHLPMRPDQVRPSALHDFAQLATLRALDLISLGVAIGFRLLDDKEGRA